MKQCLVDGIAKTHQLLRCCNGSRHCGVPEYASFLDNCAPCIWRFLFSHSLFFLSCESIIVDNFFSKCILRPSHLPSVERVTMPSFGAASAFSGLAALIRFIFSLPFALFMRSRHQKGRPRQQIPLPLGQHHQIFLGLQPKTNSFLSPPLGFPYVDDWFVGMLNDRFRPADSFTAPKVWQTVFLVFPFRNQVPESGFFALRQRVPFQAQGLTFFYFVTN